MHEDAAFAQQGARFAYAAAGLEQLLTLVAEADVETFRRMRRHPFFYHVGKVVHVDDDVRRSGLTEFFQLVLQQGLSGHFHQRLGHTVREGLESGAEPCGKDHRLHRS